MDKLILNDGSYDKIDKKELKENNHAKSLSDGKFKDYYDLSVKDLPFTRIELDNMPKLEYKELNITDRSTRHFGQRKLLLSEIEFLTLMYSKFNLKNEKKVILLYVGAAPGYHIPILINMFPNLHCHLFDPANFAINNQKNIKIFQEFFTDKHINKYYKKAQKNPILFVSDIRDPFYDNTKSDQLQNDMRLQKEWVLGIKPLGAMFKFRLLFDDNQTEYIYGDSYLPVWGPLTTTETRLICDKEGSNNWSKFKMYSNRDHEQRMMYFNNCYRMNLFNHNVNNVPGICHCYDCTSEVIIINNYIKLMNPKVKITNKLIGEWMNKISAITKRKLTDSNADFKQRQKHMRERKSKSEALKGYEEYIKNNFKV